ncbi:hypothetical protein L6164_022507 [Bauhinia variegata]|uniref:Uncharacterized protein n=1 Tax=Bauhinia variegata TaxID=167791 RepID=A0ACB9MHA8_BAUVA|nr:hypothetical protein L6164_022507 [Bauhinia variegata]
MADDQFQTSGNWWDSARNVSGASQSTSSALTNMGNFAWQQQASDMVDMKPRSSMDSMPASGSSSVVFHDTQKLQAPDSASATDPNLHMMGLGLSSQPMDWNQASLLRGGDKGGESSFRSMLQQENLSSSSTDFQQETGMGLSHQFQWREKLFSPESSTNEFKQVDSSALYGNPSMLQGLLASDHNQPQQASFDQNRAMNFPYPASYGLNSSELVHSWSKVPQFLRASPPKQPPHNQLHFTNNAPFWNASELAIKDVRSGLFPSLQTPFPTPNFDVQSKNISEIRESGSVVKKSTSEPAPNKRPRNETPSALPPFKVRKEKMGDRITALQQLVSPFGKTDTASVLSEAIEYIKFLHEQVTVLSTPYMKSGAPIQQNQQSSGKSKEAEGPKQDLRSRGLCLVPVSSTFPMNHETTVDFWTPTFGGTFG